MGRQMAQWIVAGEPELDLWTMDIRRFGSQYRSRGYTLARTTEVYATYYDIHYPNEERQAGRPLRISPTYPRLSELGCAFGEKAGWERPNWFESNAAAGDAGLRPRGWAGEHWSPAIGSESLATRQTAALFDETSFAKSDALFPPADLAASISAAYEASAGCFVMVRTRHGTTFRRAFCNFESCCKASFLYA